MVRQTLDDPQLDTAPPPAARSPEDRWDAPDEEAVGPPDTNRRLRRSKDDRVLAGVCGGLGQYLGIDPVLLRIAFVVLTVGGGSGVLLYLVGWIAIPEAETGERIGPARGRDRTTGALVVGGALIVVGVTLLLRRVLPWFDDRVVWPLVVIGIGALIAMRALKR